MRKWINKVWKWYHQQRYKDIQRFMEHPHEVQNSLLFRQLIQATKHTEWGRRYDYKSIKDYKTFAERVPVQNYDSLKPYIKRMMYGEKDVLWSGQVRWFSKSSGTTGGKSKFIPVTRQNLKQCHIRGAWDTMSLFYHNRPDANQFEYKSMLMGGTIENFKPYPKTNYGDVSAIMIDHMPIVARPFFTPDFKTALMANWEEKLERLATEAIKDSDVVMIGGVPTWTVMLFRRILEMSGKSNMLEIWPKFQLYIHGGVSFEPYREQFKSFFPSEKVDYLEIYNASEGYFSAQDDFSSNDMLLLLKNGMYYEFLPMSEWDKEYPKAIPLSDVEVGVNYALVISTNSGLWRYMPGDTIMFTSTYPYKIKVTGRTKQFVNAFGEEVIVENTDKALALTCQQMNAIVREYTVAPIYFKNADKGKGGHEWLIEFEKEPKSLQAFNQLLDKNLQQINSDYEAKRFKGIALQQLSLRSVPQDTFYDWLRSKGKFGGQHKVPRLANHRQYVDEILDFMSD